MTPPRCWRRRPFLCIDIDANRSRGSVFAPVSVRIGVLVPGAYTDIESSPSLAT